MSGPGRKDEAAAEALPVGAISAIIGARHDDPFAVLGSHKGNGSRVVEAFVPDAETLEPHTLDGRALGQLARVGVAAGLSCKYETLGADGALQPLKADPLARALELRTETSSNVAPKLAHVWGEVHLPGLSSLRYEND